jgi:beta-glucosidase
VQCYLTPPRDWPEAPFATLIAFQKIPVPAGQTVAVKFTLPATAFAQIDSAGRSVHVGGSYGLVIGSASPGDLAPALGAPSPAVTTVRVR